MITPVQIEMEVFPESFCPIHHTIEYNPQVIVEEDGTEFVDPLPYCPQCLEEATQDVYYSR